MTRTPRIAAAAAAAALFFLAWPAAAQDEGRALRFDGVDDFAEVPDNPVLRFPTNELTVEAVIVRAPDTHGTIVSKRVGGGGGRRGFKFSVDKNDTARLKIALDFGSTSLIVVSERRLPHGVPVHVAATYDGLTARLLVDGVIAGEGDGAGSIDETTALRIGSGDTGSDPLESWEGDIDEVRVWNTARTAGEIRSTLLGPLSGDEPFLVGYWRLDESDGQTILDSTANGLHGTRGWSAAVEADDPARVPGIVPDLAGRTGSVNAGAGPVTDVLLVNGKAGDGLRRVPLFPREPFVIRLDAAPAGPNPAPFVLFGFLGEPNDGHARILPAGIGTLAFPAPNGSRVVTVLDTLGDPVRLGTPLLAPRGPAPTVIAERANGVTSSTVFTLQGIIRDFGSLSPRRLSVTNSITIRIQ